MSSRRRRLPLLTLVLTAALTIYCSNAVAGPASSPTGGASAPTVGAAGGQLSGTWSGKYGGAYHGTFTLHWKQSGSRLSGTIKLSTSPGTPNVTGTVHGSTIRFGTVGSAAITYSGSVSGKSMSGSYHTPGGGGSWRAHKTG